MQRISLERRSLSLCDQRTYQIVSSLSGILTPTSPENGFSSMNSPESLAGPSLRGVIELTSYLISFSFSIKPFSGKWQLVRAKLEELLSSLNSVENVELDVLQGITDSLNHCNELAHQCRDFCFGGKLLMQSNLDMFSGKFDYHIKNLSEIYTAKLLTMNCAIVVQKPGISASSDDMKFYVGDLLSRLKISDSLMKIEALVCLNEVFLEDEKYVKVAVQEQTLISVLVNFLDSEDLGIQEESVKAICAISRFESNRIVLLGNDIIAPLIRVLESGSVLSKEYAARCLMKFTENSNNAWSVSAQGGVTVLLKIGTNLNCGSELFSLACGVLKNLVGVEEIKRFMIEESVIELFVKFIKSKDEVTQMCSIELLTKMAYGDDYVRNMIIKEDGIRLLVRILDPKSLFSCKIREVALKALGCLCLNSVASLHSVMSYGIVDHIHYFLHNGEISVQEIGLKAALWLCKTSDEAKKAMADAGFMQELVKFLDAKSFEVREIAAETLSGMVSIPRNCKKFVQSDQNVDSILKSLDLDDSNSSNRKMLLSILMSLTNCSSGRKRISKSGALQNVEKLANAEVSDAKKIIRKLSTARFRSILGGILHF